ncbi:hypothetical protein CHUAL_014128 [Chamberlinius hualienensis]
MTDLNRELRDYLSKSNTDSGAESFVSNFNASKVGKWFKSNNYSKLPTNDDAASGSGGNRWFTDDTAVDGGNSLLPSLSKKQRIIGFIMFAALGMFCLGMASLLIPFLILKARKFALLYSLGSLFLISRFGDHFIMIYIVIKLCHLYNSWSR